MSRNRIGSLREWEYDDENRDYSIEELVAHNSAQEIKYGWAPPPMVVSATKVN